MSNKGTMTSKKDNIVKHRRAIELIAIDKEGKNDPYIVELIAIDNKGNCTQTAMCN
jgi:hypothetical protein